MPKYERFEDLPVWQEAARLYNNILDVLEAGDCPFSSGFRNQIDRAGISVSNNIAEGFERTTTGELLQYLGFARGSAGEVRSMLAVVRERPRLRPWLQQIASIQAMAQSCSRQLQAWRESIEAGPVQGRRYLDADTRRRRAAAERAAEFRRKFLRQLKPTHPLYNSPEARAARGEPPEAAEDGR